MPYSYRAAHPDSETTRRDASQRRDEGYLVYNTETSKEYGVYATEEEARAACQELNDEEPGMTDQYPAT
ncbi:hypothetical protein MHM84_08755 [Halomonas sp. McH1-25]|uniref:hypothetical protein n=1 Tax=unclassified Halomonas TaxID=2609666 RepID=UPI001EF44C98|nr:MULTISPECIES: hypothetical protein [unclassified Halomonas]MCG7599875.1 hypothetical protein [Halomonas sp. McH1-25]MCP1344377.1 hypothetical protein [Halomonas sp. FL8]MCP1361597.1 hypothetical protein [Halomonas sp. BBD45]MCP1364288.1 hypothetical protein [Halomonas sp. BBD48]